MNKIGFAWYRAKDWEKLLEVSDDSDLLEKTHIEWLLNAEASFKQLEKQKLDVVKIEIDIQDLMNWCKKKRLSINSKSRSEYTANKTRELFS